MGYTKESLEVLRGRIDLVDVLSPYVRFQKAGSMQKGLCPFHQEKTPSFVVKKGDSHYHCFGCGAHGDAISFLMDYVKMSFIDSVEMLAEKFQVPLEENDSREKTCSKKILKQILEKAKDYYHTFLLHSEEGHQALKYLYKRGIDLDFIRNFELGYSPTFCSIKELLNKEKVSNEYLVETGLISKERKTDFFTGRIMFPIRDALGGVIGFSARSLLESRGPKYINTPETSLFRKSKMLFGLSYCRKKIALEKQAIIVEGQIDALRLIHSGFSITVAGQGTSFGKDHAEVLINLGVKKIYLALDGDLAGKEASVKIGDLFQAQGIEVFVLDLEESKDPDTIILDEGVASFQKYIDQSKDYLSYLVSYFQKRYDVNSPAQKSELVSSIAKKIRAWDHPLMVHESLRKLAKLTHTPESVIGVTSMKNPVVIRNSASISQAQVDPDRVLEIDLLRWLFLMGQKEPILIEICLENLSPSDFKITACRALYNFYKKSYEEKKPLDLLSLAMELEEQMFLSEILQKRVDKTRAQTHLVDTVEKILKRNWLSRKEEIKEKINSGLLSEEEMALLVKEFDEEHRKKPEVKVPQSK